MADKVFKFTRASVEAAICPPGRRIATYRDSLEPALMLCVYATGARSFIVEKKLAGKTVRVTIGPTSMQIRAPKDRRGKPISAGADSEAARLAGLVAQGIDPRAEKAATMASQAADRQAQKAERAKLEVSGLDAWAVYCEDRREHWGARNHADHLKMVQAGGAERKRSREKLTKPGPLRSLLDRPLAQVDAAAVEEWVSREAKVRPARAALGFRLVRAFLNWCGEHPEYRNIVQADAHRGRRTRERVPKAGAKNDVLQREQLKAWFAEVGKLPPVPAAYLQCLLLVGARREELAGLRWEDVDFAWKALRIRDKVEGERTIPLTPFVAGLLRDLKARNEKRPAEWRILRGRRVPVDLEAWAPSPWVFSSPGASDGRIQDPRAAHVRALAAAGLPHVSLHGLRRSFGTLAEWVEAPVGVVAQIQGHRPSATAEKHYRVRPLDLLRMWHKRIEAWILAEAGIEQPKDEEAGKPELAVVGGTAA